MSSTGCVIPIRFRSLCERPCTRIKDARVYIIYSDARVYITCGARVCVCVRVHARRICSERTCVRFSLGGSFGGSRGGDGGGGGGRGGHKSIPGPREYTRARRGCMRNARVGTGEGRLRVRGGGGCVGGDGQRSAAAAV